MAAARTVRTAADLLREADAALSAGAGVAATPVPTGFTPLDEHLGGGLRAGELTLLCGVPGLGKTLLALQVARNVSAGGGRSVVVSYEHGEGQLLERLIALEAGLLAALDPVDLEDALPLDGVRQSLQADGRSSALRQRHGSRLWASALDRIASYGERLEVVCGSSRVNDLARLRELAEAPGGRVMVVDYLQKVAAPESARTEEERTTAVAEGLKDLALETGTAVLAVVAADKHGFEGRTRLKHLRGSTALAYEADVVLVLNDKHDILARHHLMYGAVGTERFKDYVVCSIEKNRGGVDRVDLEFRKHFSQARFDPVGGTVAESLVDDRIHVDQA